MGKLTLLFAFISILFVACKKNMEPLVDPVSQYPMQEIPFCTSENLDEKQLAVYRTSSQNQRINDVPVGTRIILLSFDSVYLTNTVWNTNGYGPFGCPSASLTEAQKDSILWSVREDYSPFNVYVTREQADYDVANPNNRWRVIITQNMSSLFGVTGGLSFTGSMFWYQESPGFVFADLLGYSVKKVSEAAAHEIGHGVGLFHQSLYNAACVKTAEYNSGEGAGALGWAPIMGVSYNKNIGMWIVGPNSNGCNVIQDDYTFLKSKLGIKLDEADSTFANAAEVEGTMITGLLSSTDDVDMYKAKKLSFSFKDYFLKRKNLKKKNLISLFEILQAMVTPVRISVISGGNSDIAIDLYDHSKKLVVTLDHPTDIHILPQEIYERTFYLKVRHSSLSADLRKKPAGQYKITIVL